MLMALIHIDFVEFTIGNSLLVIWSSRGNRGYSVKDREKEINVFLVYSLTLNSRMC